MKKKSKIGQRVKIIKAAYGNGTEDRIGKIKRIHKNGEIWVDFADGSGGLVTEVEALKRGRKKESAYVYITEKLYLSSGAYSGKKKIISIKVNDKEVPFKQIDEEGRFEFL